MPTIPLLHQVHSPRSPSFLLDQTMIRFLRPHDKATRNALLPSSETYTLHDSAEQSMASVLLQGVNKFASARTRESCSLLHRVKGKPVSEILLPPTASLTKLCPLHQTFSGHAHPSSTPGALFARCHSWRRGLRLLGMIGSVVVVLRT